MRYGGWSPARDSSWQVCRAAHDFVREAFARSGHRVQEGSEPGALLVEGGGSQALVRVLGAGAPHLRGGRGNLGLHWMLMDAEADFVALVDLSRRRGWLLPVDDFRRRAQMLPGPRFHLDWLVARLPPKADPPLAETPTRSRVADEAAFEEYEFEKAIARYFTASTEEIRP